MPVFTPALAVLAYAQSGGASAVRVVDDLFACRSIVGNAERLACFDRAAATLSTARESKEVVIIDQATVKRTRRSLFGFNLPKINLFDGDGQDEADETKEIAATIRAATTIADDLWQVSLEDGSTWRFTEPIYTTPKIGDPIRIKRGALGSYFGSVRGKVGVRIRRTQ